MDQLTPFYFKTTVGMDNRTDEFDYDGKKVILAQNCRLGITTGAAVKRSPLAYYNTSEMAGSEGIGMLGIYRYYYSGGAKLIAVRDNKVYVGNDSTGVFTKIRDLSNSDRRMSFVTYNNLCIGGNGYDNMWVYDGSADNVTWELGSCKAVLSSGAGAITKSAISYMITYDGDAYICGAVSNEVSATAKNVVLSNIPLAPSGADHRKIYRKDSSTSGAYKFVAEITDDAAETYTDSTPDVSAQATVGAVTDDMPKGNILTIHKERLFITGNPVEQNRIWYSNPFLFHYIQADTNLDYMDVAKDDGDQIQGLPIHMGTMICIKQNTLRKVFVAASSANVDPATWYADDPFSFTGTPSQWSICQTPAGIVFLGWDRWYIFNGGEPVAFLPSFNASKILPSLYNNVVSYFNNSKLYASYADSETASQNNNRIMVYDFNVGEFTVDTIVSSCFTASIGADEAGELFIGSADTGFVYKAEQGDIWHRASSLTDLSSGTTNGMFLGGPEGNPVLQIGSALSPSAIPEGICIFWDDESTTPGTGWSEIISDDSFVLFSTTSGVATSTYASSVGIVADYVNSTFTRTSHGFSNGDRIVIGIDSSDSGASMPDGLADNILYYVVGATSSSFQLSWGSGGRAVSFTSNGQSVMVRKRSNATGAHYHTISGNLAISQAGYMNSGDSGPKANNQQHTHTISTASASILAYPNRVVYRVFQKNSGTTEYSFPVGSILMWDQAAAPDGWVALSYLNSNYVQLGRTNLGTAIESSHGHMFDVDSSAYTYEQDADLGSGTSICATTHTHPVAGEALSSNNKTWRLDHVSFLFIKNVSASSPWDGTMKYVYALFYGVAAAINGWEDMSATYAGKFLFMDATFTTGSASNASHTHIILDGVSGSDTPRLVGPGGYHNQALTTHTHTFTATALAENLPNPASLSFRLFRKLLGKTVSYNDAITNKYTNGLYISPVLNINAQSFGNMYFNASLEGIDIIHAFFRTGSTQVAVDTGISLTVDHAADKFTAVGHGYSNGDRVSIDATALPTGILNTILYYVVGVNGNDFQVSLSLGGAAVAFSSNGTAVTSKKWSSEIVSSGSPINATVNNFLQYLFEFVAADTTDSMPTLFYADGYVIKFNYRKSGTVAETAVEFIYATGKMINDEPMVDKIYKRLATEHTAVRGSLDVTWTTDNATNTWSVDLSRNPNRWVSFFHDNAMGEYLSLRFYKNDLEDFTLREFKGVFVMQPMLI